MTDETTTDPGEAAIEQKLAEVLTAGKRADLRVLAEMGEAGVTTDHLCHSAWLRGALLAELVTTPGGERVRLTAKGRRVVGYLEDPPASGPVPGGRVISDDDERAIARMVLEPGLLLPGPSPLERCASALERLCELFDVGPRDEPSRSDEPGPYGGFALAQAFQEWARRIEWSSASWSELTERERRDYVAIVTGIEDRADEIRRGSSASGSGTGYEHSTMAAGARPLVHDDESCCAADEQARAGVSVAAPDSHSSTCEPGTHPHGERCGSWCPCRTGDER